MNVRSLVAMIGLLAIVPTVVAVGETAPSGPNIVLLLADDMGYGDPHCFNADSKAPTPNLDRMAKEGRRFTDAHSPSSVCSPTRYALLTGRYTWRTRLKLGVLNPWDPPLIAADRLTLPALLKRQGYSTAAMGKWHLGWNWSTHSGKPVIPEKDKPFQDQIDFSRPITEGPTSRDFDYFFGMVGNTVNSPCLLENDRPIFLGQGKGPEIAGVSRKLLDNWEERNSLPVLTEKAVWYIDQRAQESPKKPFFLYFALTSPHAPLIPYGQFRGKSGHGDECDFVSQTDDSVGQVLAALERNGLASNTLVLFSSDNGSPGFADEGAPTASVIKRYGHLPNGKFRGMKGDAHEGGHRVPLIARWPGKIPAGTTCDETVCLVDMMATFAALLHENLPQNAAEDSYDILPALLGQDHPRPIREATVHHALIGMFAIRQGDWKLILGRGSGGFTLPQYFPPKPGEPEGQLFNLAEDPAEKNDLYTKHPEIVARLTALLNNYKESGRSAPTPPSASTSAR